MNRKLIRPNLAEVKGKEIEKQQQQRKQSERKSGRPNPREDRSDHLAIQRKKSPPQIDTHAEIYYYRKQIEAGTVMKIVLLDGEQIEGTIEWYDRDALKIVRNNAPNLVILRHSIKYILKAVD